MSDSAVSFATDRRVHIGLGVSNAERSMAFYQELFAAAPTKARPGYARFEVSEPPLNLSVIQTEQAKGPVDNTSHFGIQVKSLAIVQELQKRLELAGLATRVEESVNCCHAIQEKVWIADPDGHRWEIFVVVDDAPNQMANSGDECCQTTGDQTCCTVAGEPCCDGTE